VKPKHFLGPQQRAAQMSPKKQEIDGKSKKSIKQFGFFFRVGLRIFQAGFWGLQNFFFQKTETNRKGI